jgi:hypothetical protein
MALLGVPTFAAAVRVAALAELASCVRHDGPAQGILEELLGKVLATKRLTAMQLGAPHLPPTSW